MFNTIFVEVFMITFFFNGLNKSTITFDGSRDVFLEEHSSATHFYTMLHPALDGDFGAEQNYGSGALCLPYKTNLSQKYNARHFVTESKKNPIFSIS